MEALSGYKLRLEFADGVAGVADVSAMAGKGVFALWTDVSEFRKVQIGTSGELVWGERLDLCADALYMQITGQQPEETFPSLQPATVCA